MMTPIKYAAHFLNGAAFKPSDWGDEGLPIIRIAQLTGRPFDNFFSGHINRGLVVENGDLLFSWSATIDAFIWNRGQGILNQHIFKVIPKKGADKRYLYHIIKSHAPRWADDDAHGSTMKHIKKSALSNKVWLPDIETQKSIADFLDHETSRIDSLIEKRDRFNQLLDEVEKSLVAETICGHLLTTEDRRDAGWLGTVPANWDMQRMRFLFRERLGRSDSGNEELLSISHLTGVTKRSEKDVNMFLAESNIGYKLVIPGDLVVNTMWAWMGAMGISSEEGIISPSYGVYRPTSQAISSDFADLVVRSPQFIAEATRRSKGIHSSRLRLYTDALYDIPFPVPPLEDQSKLIEELHRRRRRERALRSKNELAISLLKELRSSLVTATVTGQIDPATYRRKGTTDMTLDRIEKELST